ncbi:hypothetical protein FB451DRAFT_707778 [Mycena latifolia]|nr:hypothetical protein FB451DRAFT_707778 [Mycena latifolia]
MKSPSSAGIPRPNGVWTQLSPIIQWSTDFGASPFDPGVDSLSVLASGRSNIQCRYSEWESPSVLPHCLHAELFSVKFRYTTTQWRVDAAATDRRVLRAFRSDPVRLGVGSLVNGSLLFLVFTLRPIADLALTLESSAHQPAGVSDIHHRYSASESPFVLPHCLNPRRWTAGPFKFIVSGARRRRGAESRNIKTTTFPSACWLSAQ